MTVITGESTDGARDGARRARRDTQTGAERASISPTLGQTGGTRLSHLRPANPLVGDALAAARLMPGFGTDIRSTLDWCVEVGRDAPRPGGGSTVALWELLAATAALDVAGARMLEPHLDALAILHEAGTDQAADRDPWDMDAVAATPESSWAVYAAEAPGTRLRAAPHGGSWILHGTKPWCSLAGHVSHALVTAFVDDSTRRLFAVDLRGPGVRAHPGPWHARGLAHIVSAPVDFEGAPAVPVGDNGWYLQRPGFAWGGMAVAAVWWGAAAGLIPALLAAASTDRADQLAFAHLGAADAALWGAGAALGEAAQLIDEPGAVDRRGARLLADRVRSVVVEAVTRTLAEADAALGPGPLVMDESHARRVSDLHLYLRQHHGLRDLAHLGRGLAATEAGG